MTRTTLPTRPLVLTLLVATACTGRLGESTPRDPAPRDGGPSTDRDASDPRDAGASRDTGLEPVDGATPDDGGSDPVDAGPDDPCADASCPEHAFCEPSTGSCRCESGYVPMDGGCVVPPEGDPAVRTVSQVCEEWRAGHTVDAVSPWTAGDTECAPGTLAPEAFDDVVRRVSLFRWLAGLGPVVNDPEQHPAMQQCAVMMDAAGSLSHSPGTDWPCYTEDGARAAGQANLALGRASPAASIDQFMADSHTPSVGHRRWILTPGLGSVGLGFAGRATCLGILGGGGTSDREWVAYPNQGPAPVQTAQHRWSFHPGRIDATDATVTVVRIGDGATLPVEQSYAGSFGYPPPALTWMPDGWTPAADERYEVTIGGTSEGDIVYEVHLVDC